MVEISRSVAREESGCWGVGAREDEGEGLDQKGRRGRYDVHDDDVGAGGWLGEVEVGAGAARAACWIHTSRAL